MHKEINAYDKKIWNDLYYFIISLSKAFTLFKKLGSSLVTSLSVESDIAIKSLFEISNPHVKQNKICGLNPKLLRLFTLKLCLG